MFDDLDGSNTSVTVPNASSRAKRALDELEEWELPSDLRDTIDEILVQSRKEMGALRETETSIDEANEGNDGQPPIFPSLEGFFLSHFRKRKKFVLLLSTMRSGSTLLKALLANAPDISHLPEVDWQQQADTLYSWYAYFSRLSSPG